MWQTPRLALNQANPLPPGALGCPRFALRPLTIDDVPELTRIRIKKEVTRYFPGDQPDRYQAAQIVTWITKTSAEDWLARGTGLAAILEQPLNQFIGYCGFHWIESCGKFEICYMLDPGHWGKGIATACVNTFVEHAQKHQLCDEIIGLVPANNDKSKRVLLRNGFIYKWSINEGGLEIGYFVRSLELASTRT